jgi:ribosome-associated protein
MEKVKIDTDFIKLDQLLKWINVVESGSHAKEIIFNGSVNVNGEVERRRGKKIRSGDIVEIDGKKFIIE